MENILLTRLRICYKMKLFMENFLVINFYQIITKFLKSKSKNRK